MDAFSAALLRASIPPSQPTLHIPPIPTSIVPPANPTRSTSNKRSLPSRACEACRKRKIKCFGKDNEEEPCSRCLASGRVCSWAPLRRAPKSYAESLERRCDAMEGLLRDLSLSTGVDLGGALDAADDEDKITALVEVAESLERRQREKKSAMEREIQKSTASKATEGALYHREMTIEKNRFVGASSGLNLGRLIEPVTVPWDFSPSRLDLILREERENEPDTLDLPPSDLAGSLIKAYFIHVNSLLPVLHGPSFYRAIEAGMMGTEKSFRHLAFMVFALGARFLSDARIPEIPYTPHLDPAVHSTGAKGFPYFKAANTSTASNLIPASLFDIQASVLATIYLMGSSSPIVAWNHLGWSIRRAVDVGAHSENRVRWTTSPLEDQLRKRCFHILVANDRTLSAMLGRPLSMQEHEFDLEYPIDISDNALDEWNIAGPSSTPLLASSKPTALSGLLCIFRIYVLISRAQRQLYGVTAASVESGGGKTEKIVCQYDSALNAWLGTIPEHLKWEPLMSEEHMPMSAMIYCTFYTCQALVHRELIVPRAQSRSTLPSLAICSNAARSTTHIMETLMNKGLLQDAFWYAPMQVVGAASVLIINTFSTGGLTSDGKTMASFRDVETCITVAEFLAPGSFMAWRFSDRLKKMLAYVSSRVCPSLTAVLDVDTTPRVQHSKSHSLAADLSLPVGSLVLSSPSLAIPNFSSAQPSTYSNCGLPTDLLSSVYYPPTLADSGNDWMEALGGKFDYEAWTRSLESERF